MVLISLDEAVARSGVPRESLQIWVEQGLLPVHPGNASSPQEIFFDQDELDDIVESMGWFEISSQGWDGPEES